MRLRFSRFPARGLKSWCDSVESPASLGAVVRDRRLALGYSLGQLATKVNKTAASIRAWEKGGSVPTAAEADALAAALDLDAEVLRGLLAESEVRVSEPAADVAVLNPWTASNKSAAKPSDESAAADQAPTAEPEAVDIELESELAPESGANDADIDTAPAAEAASEIEGEPDSSREAGEDEQAVAVAAVTAQDLEAADEGDEVNRADRGDGDETVDQDALGDDRESLADDAIDRNPPADAAIHEAMTEAVPVVPASVAVATHESSLEAELRTAAADPFDAARDSNPLIYWWETAVGWYRQLFDPNRRWIYRVRYVLLLIAFYIMLRLLAWAGSELWDAIGEVLDSISFSPSETPDVTN